MSNKIVENLKSKISILDITDLFRIKVKSSYGNERQVHCPFHGEDKHPSARIYLSSNSMYCFTCKESWDIISIVRKKFNYDFNQATTYLASKFNVDIESNFEKKKEKEKNNFNEYYFFAENKLISIKNSVPFNKYLTMCNFLDRISFEHSLDKHDKTNIHLVKKFIDKIDKYDN